MRQRYAPFDRPKISYSLTVPSGGRTTSALPAARVTVNRATRVSAAVRCSVGFCRVWAQESPLDHTLREARQSLLVALTLGEHSVRTLPFFVQFVILINLHTF